MPLEVDAEKPTPSIQLQVQPLAMEQLLNRLRDRVLQFPVIGHQLAGVVHAGRQIDGQSARLQHVEMGESVAEGRGRLSLFQGPELRAYTARDLKGRARGVHRAERLHNLALPQLRRSIAGKHVRRPLPRLMDQGKGDEVKIALPRPEKSASRPRTAIIRR